MSWKRHFLKMGQLHEDKSEAGGGYVLKVLQGYIDELESRAGTCLGANEGETLAICAFCREHVGMAGSAAATLSGPPPTDGILGETLRSGVTGSQV